MFEGMHVMDGVRLTTRGPTMHARSDYAHAAAVERILRANGVAPERALGEDRSHRGGGPFGGRGLAVTDRQQSLRAARPRSGGC
jgi:hypothetical protein